jgi:hypothetical protein
MFRIRDPFQASEADEDERVCRKESLLVLRIVHPGDYLLFYLALPCDDFVQEESWYMEPVLFVIDFRRFAMAVNTISVQEAESLVVHKQPYPL